MKRIVIFTLLLSAAQFGYAAGEAVSGIMPAPVISAPVKTEPVKPAVVAFNTKDASVNMAAIKKNPVFDERYKRLEVAYKRTLANLQEEEQKIQQNVKAGKISESELYGKSQQFEFEFRKAQKEMQEGAMKLEETVDMIIAEILRAEGWDGCQVQYFSYINPARDITDRVIGKLEEKLKAEEAAEKFKKTAVAPAEPKVKSVEKPTDSTQPAVKPAPKKKPAIKA